MLELVSDIVKTKTLKYLEYVEHIRCIVSSFLVMHLLMAFRHRLPFWNFCFYSMRNSTVRAKSMWVWNTVDILSDTTHAQATTLIQGVSAIHVTDLYLYMAPSMYTEYNSSVSAFITNATSSQIRVWALDGDRSYIAEPSPFYAGE